MNFIDRTSLGNKLAHRFERFRDKDAVILCLQESSLMTCLTMASYLRAWVYPLIYIPVYEPDRTHSLLGAFDQDGEFCPIPDSYAVTSKTPREMVDILHDQRPAALKSIRAQKDSYGITLDKHRLDGRHVILVGDVITSPLSLFVAHELLKSVAPKDLTAVAGNVTPEVAQLVRISAGDTEILDIMSGVVFDDDHYFEHADEYTPKQKHTLTEHISAYWQ
jgi:predicted phosphoribosyltransferase